VVILMFVFLFGIVLGILVVRSIMFLMGGVMSGMVCMRRIREEIMGLGLVLGK